MPDNSEKTIQTRKTQNFSQMTPLMQELIVNDVARAYVKYGLKPAELARREGITLKQLKEISESRHWKEACECHGFFGEEAYPLRNRIHLPEYRNPRPMGKPYPSIRTPYPLTEKFLLETAFQKEGVVRFSTYKKRFTDARVKSVEKYDIRLELGGSEVLLKKLNILFAFPKTKMPDLKYGIKKRPSLANEDLPPVERKSDRDKFKIDVPLGSIVECVMRNGYVITGQLTWNSLYTLVMRVGGRGKRRGKIIIVYKHGLYEFNLIKCVKKRRKRYDDEFDEEIE